MNLPQTSFPMRGNLAQNEPKRLQKWEEQDIYHKVLEKNKDGKPFVLHDGPPYANGPIHIGHAFNKILKDFVIKSKAQRGYYAPFIPGWDCHGQPIEHIVEEKLGPEKMAKISKPELRKLCHEHASKCVDLQRDGFKRLGVNGDWENPYLTYQHDYEKGNVEVFKDMYLKGSIYQGRKPIHWCKHCHTALAEAEIEYEDITGPSIFVKFKLNEIPKCFENIDLDNAYVLIWTTTPWTLPANTAVAVAPDAEYGFVKVGDDHLLIALDMIEQIAEISAWDNYEVIEGCIKGKDLEGLTYVCPVRQDLTGKFIYADYVTLDTGTGCVHTAPGHGQDDYYAGLKFGIDMLMPVDDNGVLTKDAGQFEGLDVFEANPVITKWLDSQGTLVAKIDITHSYPHCWRCHQPVIFRATNQWFVSIDKNDLRKNSMEEIENKVHWIPAWAKNRISSMVSERPDWCISRQRSWGVPIPVFKCKDCGEVVASPETFDAVINLFDKHGSDAWFTKEPGEYLPKDTKCEKCGCEVLLPESDILDVWWESGVSHTSVCIHRKKDGLDFPADMYLEGSDQHRGWFQSSLLTSVGTYGCAPFKSVMHCGFTVDEDGKKMSKSLGNGIDPAEVFNKYGADVLRLWVSSVDYSQDVRISDNILKRTTDAYRKFRNTFRYLLSNLYDFNFEKDSIKNFDDLLPIDKRAMANLALFLNKVNAAYDSYTFHQIFRMLYDYISGDLSNTYMDIVKDRLYSDAPDSHRRRSAQTVLANVLEVFVRVFFPILSFTCEEVWEHYPQGLKTPDFPESVQLAGWPAVEDFSPALPSSSEEILNEIVRDFEPGLSLRNLVTKALEDEREKGNINKSQEACVVIKAPKDMLDIYESYGKLTLLSLFIVSEIEFEEIKGSGEDDVVIEIKLAHGERCPRCWNHLELIDINGERLCERCHEVLGH
ncbi:MAG: isoleucine--tRNA ligase [Enterococcus sp.]|nr:isoleucine--tRNA ligase [Enterococcus sp.]